VAAAQIRQVRKEATVSERRGDAERPASSVRVFTHPPVRATFHLMPYEITATRKRPQGFDELAGQEFVSATLEASLGSGRIAHAYLFSGPRGCGKTSTARILAKALNCEKGPSATPCGVCANCRSIAAGSSLDVIEIDGASNTSVEGVRQIKDEVLFPPNSARYKVYIIDEVHMLSMSAFNALLKTIEEPPPYVVFIFATTELHKVPPTIKSRCQQFAFRLIPIDTIRDRLVSAAADLSVKAEDAALLWIAKESGGSLRDAYTLFDQVVAFSGTSITAAGIREKLGLVGLEAMNGLFEAIVEEGGAGRALDALDALLSGGVSPEQFSIDAMDYLRALLLIGNGMGRESLIGAPVTAYSERVLAALDTERLERGLGLFLDLHRNLRTSPNPRFELELAVTRLSRLRDFVSPAALARAVASLRAGGAPGSGSGRQSVPAEGGASPLPPSSSSKAAPPAEKKKPDLMAGMPTSLSRAMSSLAGAVLGDSRPASPTENLAAPAPAPAPAPARETAPPPPTRPKAEPEAWVEERREDRTVGQSEVTQEPRPSPAALESGEEEEASVGEGLFIDEAELKAETPVGLAGGIDAFRRDIVAKVGRTNPIMGSGLAASLDWATEGERLIIAFRTGMEEGLVRAELGLLTAVVREAAGRDLKVELRVRPDAEGRRKQGATESDHSDPVIIVERMFRGQRIESKQRGGQDEYR